MSNSGVFDVNDIRYLMDYQQWSGVGTLELIQTQTISATVTQVDFTSIKESIYNVHFLTWNNLHQSTDNKKVQAQLFESGVIESGSVYQTANQFYRADDTFVESNSTGASAMRLTGNNGNAGNETTNGYFYGYNFGDSSKYSYITLQSSSSDTSDSYHGDFGGSVLPQASIVDGIRLNMTGGNIASGDFSLYGIRYS